MIHQIVVIQFVAAPAYVQSSTELRTTNSMTRSPSPVWSHDRRRIPRPAGADSSANLFGPHVPLSALARRRHRWIHPSSRRAVDGPPALVRGSRRRRLLPPLARCRPSRSLAPFNSPAPSIIAHPRRARSALSPAGRLLAIELTCRGMQRRVIWFCSFIAHREHVFLPSRTPCANPPSIQPCTA